MCAARTSQKRKRRSSKISRSWTSTIVARVRDARQSFHFEFGELVEAIERFYDDDLAPLVDWQPDPAPG